MLQARLQRRGDESVQGTRITTPVNIRETERGRETADVREQNVAGSGYTSPRAKIRRSTQTVGQRFRGAVAKGMAVALMIGSMAGAASAQTRVNEGVPLKPVEIRVQQERQLGTNAPALTRMRSGHTMSDHQQRAAVTYPFIGAIQTPARAGDKMSIMAHESLWRMISVAAEEAEGTPELTNMIPTSPVKGSLVWQPQIEVNGRKIDVLPLLLPQLRRPNGTLDVDKLKELYLRVNNPAPRSDANGIFLAENIGFQNGRAGYFSINSINPEPVQPHDSAGTLLLPQLTLEVNGRKTVYTIGSLCYKGGGPSFKPDGSYSYGYSSDRQKTPLNMTDRRPIYSGNSSFGLFEWDQSSKANDYGWQFLDHGAYVGVSIMHFKLDELVDYQVDALGKPTGEPQAISITELQQSGRLAQNKSFSLLWRAFETEYRLSSFKNPTEGVAVLTHMRQLFARDAIFDHIANDPALARQWEAASARVRAGGSESLMQTVWQEATTSLNAQIRSGSHYAKDPITLGSDGVATMTVDDYVRTAIERSARNVVVLHKLGFNHNSIAAGGDNVNAAWQMVDLDDLNQATWASGSDPKDHSNVSEFTSNLQMMVDDLKDRVPEMRKYDGRMQDLLKQAIDRQAPIYGRGAQGSGNG